VYEHRHPDDDNDHPITWPHRPLPPRGEWVQTRQTHISASKVALLLGVSKYVSGKAGIERLRAEYRGVKWDPPAPVRAAMEWGNCYEQDAIDQLNFCLQRFPYASGVYHCNTIYSWCAQNPTYTATLDGVLYKGTVPVAVVEVKCPASLRFPGDRDARGVKTAIQPDYILQVQWQMMVTGLRQAWLVYYRPAGGSGVPSITGHLRVYRITFDGDLMPSIMNEAQDIWDTYIVPDEADTSTFRSSYHADLLTRFIKPEQVVLPLHFDTDYLKKVPPQSGR